MEGLFAPTGQRVFSAHGSCEEGGTQVRRVPRPARFQHNPPRVSGESYQRVQQGHLGKEHLGDAFPAVGRHENGQVRALPRRAPEGDQLSGLSQVNGKRSMNMTRRELLTFAGGSILGALFTPIPWKLLDDSSIWTQNWSLIPGLPRGPETLPPPDASICPGGCAVRARRINGQPVTLAGVPADPLKSGALCPMGIAGHHLAFHPLRLREPSRSPERVPYATLVPVGLDEVVSKVARTIQDLSAASMPGAIASPASTAWKGESPDSTGSSWEAPAGNIHRGPGIRETDAGRSPETVLFQRGIARL